MFGASKYKIEAISDGELIDTRLELPGGPRTREDHDPVDRAVLKPSLWKSIERPLAAIFICVTLMVGGAGAGLETWWRQTGRYLVPAKRKSPRLLQRMVTVAEVKKKEPAGPANRRDLKPNVLIVDSKPEPKPVAPAPGETIVDVGSGEVATLTEPGADDTKVDPGLESPTGVEDVRTRMKKKVAASFPIKKKRKAPRNDDPNRGREAAFQLLAGTHGIDAGDFDNGNAGMRKQRRDGSFGDGPLASGGGDEREVTLGEMADAETGKRKSGGGLGHSVAANPFLAGEVDLPGPSDMGNIAGKAGKLDIKVGGNKKETKIKDTLRIRKPRDPIGPVDGQAVWQHIRGNRGALGRCYRRFASKNPYVSGKIRVRIRIDMTGRVKAKVITNSVEDREFAACIVDKFQGFNLPAPEKKPVEMVIPLVFRSQ